ncbi:DUF6691 family protein [Janthinobacterium sp. LB3P118]|uniref:DUF6691 family protein n=1 Tax=Janthinobacterium sp. LB3P118 TaxID=3424195 RepID=UPI003F2653A7
MKFLGKRAKRQGLRCCRGIDIKEIFFRTGTKSFAWDALHELMGRAVDEIELNAIREPRLTTSGISGVHDLHTRKSGSQSDDAYRSMAATGSGSQNCVAVGHAGKGWMICGSTQAVEDWQLRFGIGWGLAGYFPGPAVASLASGGIKPLVFFVPMLPGMGIFALA